MADTSSVSEHSSYTAHTKSVCVCVCKHWPTWPVPTPSLADNTALRNPTADLGRKYGGFATVDRACTGTSGGIGKQEETFAPLRHL